jgi:hypothetical protein
MFNFIVKHVGFLKHVPLLPHVFDSWLKVYSMLTQPRVLHYIDEIEAEVLTWKYASISLHKYGGTQFNVDRKEIGHIHSNGLMDVLLKKSLKRELLQAGRITNHHTFNNSGWISFYIRNDSDRDYAIRLLKLSGCKSIHKL